MLISFRIEIILRFEHLAEIFENTIGPLLQEYFYEDYKNIHLVFGDNNKDTKESQFLVLWSKMTTKSYSEVQTLISMVLLHMKSIDQPLVILIHTVQFYYSLKCKMRKTYQITEQGSFVRGKEIFVSIFLPTETFDTLENFVLLNNTNVVD